MVNHSISADIAAMLRFLKRHLDPAKRRNPRMRGITNILNAAPRIVCADGFSMSVQAGEAIYCTPRNSDGPWTAVEVGFPSAKADLLMPYAEEPDKPTDTVYGYVPVSVVAQVIIDHGGPQVF